MASIERVVIDCAANKHLQTTSRLLALLVACCMGAAHLPRHVLQNQLDMAAAVLSSVLHELSVCIVCLHLAVLGHTSHEYEP
jgi:hypothetical protein